MNNLMEYRGFTAKIEYSTDDEVFFGRLLGTEDVVTFEGQTVEQLKDAMKEAVDFHIEVCEKAGRKAKNYSGKLLFRFNSELHAKIARAAARRGKSVNEFGKEIFETAVKS